MNGLTGRSWQIATIGAFLVALVATAPTVADFGLTYDEPAYRHSQMVSVQWWERLAEARSSADLDAILDPDALLYYWPYGRHGINFHPPLGGQLNLLTYELFGGFLKDIPARRMASVLEFSATVALLFGFLARRSGPWVGAIAAGSLLLMPRLYGQAHLIDTDTPGLLIWVAASFAAWKGITEEGAGLWRVLAGVLLGLAFVEKMGAVLVVLPILGWLVLARLRKADRAAWIDGLVTSAALLAPLAVAYLEVRRLSEEFLRIQVAMGLNPGLRTPARTDLFRDHPSTWMPGAFLLCPLGVWLVRRAIGRLLKGNPVWGRERPGLEMWEALLAFAPAVAWLGNPAWWREALPRLAHYYAITTTRRGVLPDIQVLYFGQNYEYSLPWPNAWVLIAITVPATILVTAVAGLILAPWREDLPKFFLLNLATLPVMRMFETPAHDGVRLFLPAFAFLAAFAGWGTVGLAKLLRHRSATPALALLVLAPAAVDLVRIHPFELSYYNAFIGGPRGAWREGFELSYWYDAFTTDAYSDLNEKLPEGAKLDFVNGQSNPVMVLEDEQSLGVLRGDLEISPPVDSFPFAILLTHDSKADAVSRLLFAMKPWWALRPRQLGGLRVATVADPEAHSRAWALQLLLDRRDTSKPPPPRSPEWVRTYLKPLARLWGDGLTPSGRLGVQPDLLNWAKSDPEGLRAAGDRIARREPVAGHPGAERLMDLMNRYPDRAKTLLRIRPEAVREAVEIAIQRPDALRAILLRYGYTDPDSIGGPL